MKKIVKIIVFFFVILFLFIIIHNILLALEVRNINRSSSYLEKDNESIHYYDSGKGKDTIVFLSGFGTASPIIDYRPLTELLEEDFRIIVIEYLGYGYSDDTEKARTVENISDEIHFVLNELKIKKYILAAHSLSGIYARYYIGKYRDEVSAYIGIENAIPEYLAGMNIPDATLIDKITRRSGVLRLIGIVSPDSLFGKGLEDVYTESEIRESGKAIIRNYKNTAQLGEIELYSRNVAKVSEVRMDDHIPCLFFVSQNSHNNQEKWIEEHQKIIDEQVDSKLIEYDGSHYLYHEKYREMAKDIKAFL